MTDKDRQEAAFVQYTFAVLGIATDVSVEDRCVVLEMDDALRLAQALNDLRMSGYDVPLREYVATPWSDAISGVGLTDPDEAAAAAERTVQ